MELISIIMGVYNCEKTVSQAIESILDQTYENWELIICDDCSTDNTFIIVDEFRRRFPEKITLMQNEHNMRLSYTLNRCLDHSKGYYIARMDGDDISRKDRLEKQVKYLKEHPGIQLVGTGMQQFNDSGLIQVIEKPEHPDRWTLHTCIPFNHATIMTYKYIYDSLGGYTVSERTKRGQDYDLWFRFFHSGYSGDNINDPLYYVREDMNAIKRRTFKMRWEVFQTTRYGFRLLQYPRIWIVGAFFRTLFKSLTPYKIQYLYRLFQKRSAMK